MSQPSDSVARWREVIARRQASEWSVAAFCRRARISQSSCYTLRRKLCDSAAFAVVTVTLEAANDTDSLELRLPGEHRVVVRPRFDRATLLELLHTLGRDAAGVAGHEAGG